MVFGGLYRANNFLFNAKLEQHNEPNIHRTLHFVGEGPRLHVFNFVWQFVFVILLVPGVRDSTLFAFTRYMLTVPWIPIIHFFGLNDTGSLFALEWWMHFPDEGAGGKCNKDCVFRVFGIPLLCICFSSLSLSQQGLLEQMGA